MGRLGGGGAGKREEEGSSSCFVVLPHIFPLNRDGDGFLLGKLVAPEKRALSFKKTKLFLPAQIMPIFVALCPSHLHQLLLLFGLQLLENVWGLLFPSINSWLRRATCSRALATDRAWNPVPHHPPLGSRGDRGCRILEESV